MPRRVIRFIDKPVEDYEECHDKRYGVAISHKYLTKVKLTPNKYNCDIIFKCICDEHVLISRSAYYSIERAGTADAYHCGCLMKKVKKEVKYKYTTRNLFKTVEFNKKCKSCAGYYESLTRQNQCFNCTEVDRLGVMVYETFEGIMEKWCPECHNKKYKRLPYVAGTSGKGYRIKGFSYIDSSLYNEASKVMWIKSGRYLQFCLSKGNLKRLGKIYLHRKGRPTYINLHRYILGLGIYVEAMGDHISGVSLDNRRCNLRVVSILENSHNSRKNKNTTKGSKYKGVSINSKCVNKKWRLNLKRGGSNYSVGFDKEIHAAKHYDYLLREKHPSNFNRYNFPLEGELGVKP